MIHHSPFISYSHFTCFPTYWILSKRSDPYINSSGTWSDVRIVSWISPRLDILWRQVRFLYSILICALAIWWFQNGFFSALPFVGLVAAAIILPLFADKLRSTGVMQTITVRKVFNSVGKCLHFTVIISVVH